MSILENANERELRNLLRKYASKSITTGNIPRIIVKLKFYFNQMMN